MTKCVFKHKTVENITNERQHAEASVAEVHDGCVEVNMPADSFITIIASAK